MVIVQVDPPIVDRNNPTEKIHWHFAVYARSASEALRIVRNYPPHRGMPARVIAILTSCSA